MPLTRVIDYVLSDFIKLFLISDYAIMETGLPGEGRINVAYLVVQALLNPRIIADKLLLCGPNLFL